MQLASENVQHGHGFPGGGLGDWRWTKVDSCAGLLREAGIGTTDKTLCPRETDVDHGWGRLRMTVKCQASHSVASSPKHQDLAPRLDDVSVAQDMAADSPPVHVGAVARHIVRENVFRAFGQDPKVPL